LLRSEGVVGASYIPAGVNVITPLTTFTVAVFVDKPHEVLPVHVIEPVEELVKLGTVDTPEEGLYPAVVKLAKEIVVALGLSTTYATDAV
jgi:hypothetical protein